MKQVVLTFIFLSVSLAIAAPLLSFTDVCTLALTKNKYLLTKIEDYEIAKTQTDQAWATVLPSLKLESSYSKYHASLGGGTSAALTGFFTGLAQVIPSLNALMAGGSPFASENDTYTTKISVSQVIFGTHILPTLEASQSALKMAEANVNQQKQQLLSDVATQYFQLVKLEKNLTLLLDTKRSFEQHYKNTEELINNGFAYNNALLRIEVEMARIEKNILDLRNAEQNAKTAFSNFIGYPLAENFDLTFSLEVPFPVTDNFSLDFASIIDQRSDVQSIKQMILLLEANIALNASKSWPVLFAAGSYGYVNGQKFSFSDADKEWMVALSGSWQLFDGMSTAAKVDEARHNLKKMQINLDLLTQGIELEMKAVRSAISSAHQKIILSERSLSLAKDNLNQVKTLYNLGSATNIDVLDAQNMLFSAQKDLMESQIDVVLAQISVLKTQGLLIYSGH